MPGIYDADKTAALRVLELGDTIFIAESEKVPFSRLLKRGDKPKQMLATWPVQAYPTRAFGGTLDGTDMTSFTHTNRDALEAYGMWLRTDGWQVSKLSNLTATAGVPVGKEKAKQATDDSLIMAQMIERVLLSANDQTAESGGTPYRVRGAFSWLSPSAQTVKPVPAPYRPGSASQYTGAIASLTATLFENLLEQAATEKKGPVNLTGYVGIDLKRKMTDWAVHDSDFSSTNAALQSYNINASEKKLIRTVDMFQFDSGSVMTFLSWYLACTEGTGETSTYSPKSGLFVDLDMWELCFHQAPQSYELEDQGGGPRGYHDAVFMLKCLNPLGQCSVYTAS